MFKHKVTCSLECYDTITSSYCVMYSYMYRAFLSTASMAIILANLSVTHTLLNHRCPLAKSTPLISIENTPQGRLLQII